MSVCATSGLGLARKLSPLLILTQPICGFAGSDHWIKVLTRAISFSGHFHWRSWFFRGCLLHSEFLTQSNWKSQNFATNLRFFWIVSNSDRSNLEIRRKVFSFPIFSKSDLTFQSSNEFHLGMWEIGCRRWDPTLWISGWLFLPDYIWLLQLKICKRTSFEISVVLIGNIIAFATQSSSLNLCHWFRSIKSRITSISYSQSLLTVIMPNGSQMVARIGQASPLRSLTLTSVLYILGCPLNLTSISRSSQTLDCWVTFFNYFVVIQERSNRGIIGTKCEAHGL